jgi:hypothetical protein
LRQYSSVVGRKLTRDLALALALLCGMVAAVGGCDAVVTSVGSWEPIVAQPPTTAGQGGSAGSAGSSGVGGVGGLVAQAGAIGEAGAIEPTGPGLYLEAEDAEFSSDPTVPDSAFAIISDPTASHGKYILPPASLASDDSPGSAQARYAFNLTKGGDYIIWGRLYTPDVTSNRIWYQVDGGVWYKWRMTVGTIWYWHFFDDDMLYNNALRFMLSAGAHQLLIANDTPGARLDKLYITANGDVPPGNTTKCFPPHTIDRGGPTCEPSCGVQAKPNMPTSCTCAAGVPTFYAYDCTSKMCCFAP